MRETGEERNRLKRGDRQTDERAAKAFGKRKRLGVLSRNMCPRGHSLAGCSRPERRNAGWVPRRVGVGRA